MLKLCRGLVLGMLVLPAAALLAQSSYWYLHPIRPTFTTAEKAYLSLTYYGRPGGIVLDLFYSPPDTSWQVASRIDGRKPDHTLRPTLHPNGKKRYTDEALLVPADKPGYYVVRGRMFGTTRTVTFTVSDIAMVVKRAPGQLVVWVVNRATDAPVPNAEVTVTSPEGSQVFARGRTGPDGIWTGAGFEGDAYVSARYGEHLAQADPRYSGYYDRYYGSGSGNLVYVYTDRPVYRPGHTVYFKGIAREWVGGRYEEASGRQVAVEVRDEYDTAIHTAQLASDAMGAFSGEFQLSSSATPGVYRIRADLGEDLIGSASFTIAEYRKPEYKVTLTMEPPVVVTGSPLRARLEARYYFGAPLPNARVRWSGYVNTRWWGWEEFVPKPEEEPLWVSEREEESYQTAGYAWGEIPIKGEGVTDANGLLIIDLPTTFRNRTLDRPLSLRISAEVLDIAGREGSTGAEATILPAGCFVHVDTANWLGKVGQPTEAVMTVLDAIAGSRVSGAEFKFEVISSRWVLANKRWREVRRVVEETVLRAGPDGTVRYNFTPSEPGSYRLATTVKDAQGRTGRYETYYWVRGAGDYWGSSASLQLIPSKRRVEPGEALTVLFQTSVPETALWYAVEGSAIHRQGVLQVRDNLAAIDLQIEPEMMPSVTVWAAYCHNGAMKEGRVSISVVDLSRILKVEVSPAQERYMPGEQATYRIRTTDMQGSPVPAEVSLGVVDEALYAIRSDWAPDIRTFFYGSRANRVLTYRSRSLQYETTPVPGRVFQKDILTKEAQVGEARLRKEFRDTAFWQPAVRTDQNGEALVRFELPDNLTQWRATARAVGAGTAVGEGIDKRLRVTKPLIASLNLPRFLTQGDRFRVVAVVRNTTDHPQTAELVLSVDGGLTLETQPDKTVSVPAHGERRYDITARADEPGEARLVMEVNSGTHEDAVVKPLTIQPFASKRVHSVSGTVKYATRNRVPLAKERNPGSESVEFRLAPSVASMVLGSVEELAEYPYGCIEQTTSPMLADLALLDLIRSRGDPDPALVAKLTDMIGVGIRRLYQKQDYSGGWGWGDYSESDAYWTAYALGALLQARSAGFEVRKDVLERGIRQLGGLMVSLAPKKPSKRGKTSFEYSHALWRYRRELHAKVHGLVTLSEVQPEAWRRAMLRMADRADEIGDSGLAMLIIGLRNVAEEAKAREALGKLMAHRKDASGLTYWPVDRRGWDSYWWYFGEQETFVTAAALRAIVRFDPDPDLVEGIVTWLAGQRRGRAWMSTNDTARIAQALADYTRYAGGTEFSGTLKLYLNGHQVREAEVPPGAAQEVVWNLKAEELAPDDNIWELRLIGDGSVRYTAVTRYTVPFELKPTSQGITVTRSYHKLHKTVKTYKYGSDTWTEDVYSTRPLRGVAVPGMEVVVKLTVKSDAPMRHLIIEDPLPAGLEPIDEKNSQYLYTGWLLEREGNGYYWHGYSQREFHDDRVVMLIEDLPAGTRSYYYVVRAVTPGEFRAAPAVAVQMYMPSVSASGSSDRLTVKSR
jgi:uncharacterized protein YfaS (alpha-2-macroglobulin family)